MTAAERKEAETFGKSPTLVDDILADCEKRGLMGERNNVLLLYVAMTSRKRDTPLSVLILSSSGAGKTALQDAVLAFCPPEDLVKLTALSGKALFYKERLSPQTQGAWRWRKATAPRKPCTPFAISSAPGNSPAKAPSKTWPPGA